MEEELKEIVVLMNKFSKKYECKLEIETYESMYMDTKEKKTIYRLVAVKPERIIAQA